MKTKNIEFTSSGLQCDSCDWKDTTIPVSSFPEWVNRACPKCGENVLTQEDCDNSMKIVAVVDYMNSLTEKELQDLRNAVLSPDKYKLVSELFQKEMKIGDTLIEDWKSVVMTISCHKGIKIDEIKNVD